MATRAKGASRATARRTASNRATSASQTQGKATPLDLAALLTDPQTKIVWPEFDPYSPSGLQVMAHIDELIARGRVIEAPSSTGTA